MQRILTGILGLFIILGCGFSEEDHHHHVAPNGGVLIPLGDHSGNIELLFDPESGKVRIWLLDGCAENYVRSAQKEIHLVIRRQEITPGVTSAENDRVIRLKLSALKNRLTGETVGNTSEFGAIIDSLKGVKKFTGFFDKVEFRGFEFEKVPAHWDEQAN
ncbi:MAG: hypothetical protein H3C47_10475 [Candidatus Cloacimonetes bacterium]|nr:hypothetical protein [Candidatus Cloacimonadota bacterium]